jgi:hypothetical protein
MPPALKGDNPVNIEFQVLGTNAAEIEERAREVCDRFFGDLRYIMAMEAGPAIKSAEGEILRWEATVGATATHRRSTVSPMPGSAG